MLKILNRIAWFTSFSMGLLLTLLFGIKLDFLDSSYAFNDDTILIWMLFIGIISLIFKVLFLRKGFIRDALQENKIKADQIEDLASTVVENSQNELSLVKTDNIQNVEKQIEEFSEIFKEGYLKTLFQTALGVFKNDSVGNQVNHKELKKEEETKYDFEKKATKKTKPQGPNFFQKFFAENSLAKIGGILIFLGVLFLLQLVYSKIGPVGKLLIGFAIGFITYGVGVFLDIKNFKKESRVLMGTGILINYLVILSGRFLIGDGDFTDKMLLNEAITFFLLIVNTIFAVVTSLVYHSNSLLFFSFVFAFLNPFLIGGSSETPYVLCGYGMIVSLGAVVLSIFLRSQVAKYSSALLYVAFFGGNILFFLAPFQSVSGWLFKLAMLTILTLISLFVAYYNKQNQTIVIYFLGAYLFFILLVFSGHYMLRNTFHSLWILNTNLLFLFILFITGIASFILTGLRYLTYFLILPLFILIALFYSNIFALSYMVFVLPGTVVCYLITFIFLSTHFVKEIKYIFFGILGLFITLLSLLLHPAIQIEIIGTEESMNFLFSEAVGIVITSFLFLLSAFYFSRKKGLEYLYAFGSFFGVLMLLPILQREGELVVLSVLSIVTFSFLNILVPFLNKNLQKNNLINLAIGLIIGVLFSAGEIFYFGEKYFSGVEIGLAFLAQAVLYFVLGYLMFMQMQVSFSSNTKKNLTQQKKSAKNVVYTLLGISISLFSLAIAFVFSKHNEVISAVWLFEATLLFFFYKKTEDFKIYFAGIILMFVGLWKMFVLIDLVETKEFLTLVPLAIIFVFLVVSLKFLESFKIRVLHDFGHLIGVILIGILLLNIIPNHDYGWAIFTISVFSLVLAFVYSYFEVRGIKYVFSAFLINFFIYQIEQQNSIYTNLQHHELNYLKGLQYLSTLLLGGAVYLFNYFYKNKTIKLNKFLKGGYACYLFVITTIYVYDIFADNEFTITIYWGILAFTALAYGIQKNIIKYRTLGLYILSLTVGKILLYDVWSGLSDAITRILALMFVGILMIVISVLYTKKYGNNLKDEFNPENLK